MEHGVHALAALLRQREDGVAEKGLAGDDDDLKVERDLFQTINNCFFKDRVFIPAVHPLRLVSKQQRQ